MFKKMKKQNGETFAKTVRSFHNGIFEIPDILDIVKHAGRGRQDAESVLPYLVSLLQDDRGDEPEAADPFELLKQAGYSAYYADTLKKQNKIEKYFEPNESLCTFNDTERFKNYYIVNCVHEDATSLDRKQFSGKEKRQDTYGTSVISIQIAKRGGFISIKNRYNHTVQNCDNTFGSNPDRIISGLSKALQDHFGISFSSTAMIPDNCVLAGKQLVKVAQEINAVNIGEHCYVHEGVLHGMKEHEYLFDYFIFNAQSKTFRFVEGIDIQDSFVEAFNDAYGGSPTVYVKKHCIYDGETMLVGV